MRNGINDNESITVNNCDNARYDVTRYINNMIRISISNIYIYIRSLSNAYVKNGEFERTNDIAPSYDSTLSESFRDRLHGRAKSVSVFKANVV